MKKDTDYAIRQANIAFGVQYREKTDIGDVLIAIGFAAFIVILIFANC